MSLLNAKILLKRDFGDPSLLLDLGEPGFDISSNKFYIGRGIGNLPLLVNDVSGFLTSDDVSGFLTSGDVSGTYLTIADASESYVSISDAIFTEDSSYYIIPEEGDDEYLSVIPNLPYVYKGGDSLLGDLNMKNNRILNLAYPINSSDSTNKIYVDEKLFTINASISAINASMPAKGAIDITYADLMAAIDAEELIAGQYYRITDYKTVHYLTTYDTEEWWGEVYVEDSDGQVIIEGEVEPLIVLATSSSTLALDAWSETHPEDRITYESSIGNWVLCKAFIKEDVVVPGFTGIITYRSDTVNNLNHPFDWRVLKYNEAQTPVFGDGCFNITVPERSNSESTILPYIVFGEECSQMTFGIACYSITFGNSCGGMIFGNSCGYMIFGEECSHIIFGNSCYGMTFGNDCYGMTFGDSCGHMTFGNSCYGMTFGNDCYGMTFGDSCGHMTFGNSCFDITFGNDCYIMTFGNSCSGMIFGDGVAKNNFLDGCTTKDFTASGIVEITDSSNITHQMCGTKLVGSYLTESEGVFTMNYAEDIIGVYVAP